MFYARITFRVHLKLLFSLEMFFYCGGFNARNCVARTFSHDLIQLRDDCGDNGG